ncbi:SDR family NAD(P)-dependent oxidoreductase [Levilinea saccharolytica]|uniref:Dehydrogenase n=1 Tax=Levilinea saccharolytica TaxID=229921 RepID=A0A0P6YTY4_9CHLR|nr:SDR family oxidoreductase [Levilinea saccharolytica]KPL86997.1 hypothetical protein ADN01_05175 [Levilinea saccharolytica]
MPLAVVTGAGQRLGRAIALGLAARGYAVGLHYHASAQAAEETAAEIRAQGGRSFLAQADLRDEGQIARLFAQVDGWDHPLRVWVNSAAVMPAQDADTMAAEEWDAVMDLNLRAPFLCAQQAARRMDSGGVIINLSDSGAVKAWSGFPAYTVSKAGVEALTRVLARRWGPRVRVNAVAPGLILRGEMTTAEEWQALTGRLPMRQGGGPQDVVRAVVFLIENPYITGETLVVDGGYRLI